MATTTELIHRPYTGPRDWWRERVFYEVDSWQIDNGQLQTMQENLLAHAVSLGFGAIVLRPALVPIESDPSVFKAFVADAHARGLRVIVRISGALTPLFGPQIVRNPQIFVGLESGGEALVNRADAFLKAGADGVDLGALVPPELSDDTDLDLLSSFLVQIQAQVLSRCEDGMVAAGVSDDYPESFQRHFQEDWLHHLRDDALSTVRWRADSLYRQLTRSFDIHDRFGAAPVWRILPYTKLVGRATPANDEEPWFVGNMEQRVSRARALLVLSLALPGATYIRQADELGTPDEQKSNSAVELSAFVATMAQQEGSPEKLAAANIRHALSLRSQHDLAAAAFAVVEGLDWCPPQVFTFLSRDVLVLLNTSESGISLPSSAQVLLASSTLHREGDRIVVPPNACVWLDSASVA